MKKDLASFVKFFHEVGMLANIPRSGFAFLGSGKQSVAEHSYRMTLIAFILANLVEKDEPVDLKKLLLMCLIHDFPEARTSDLNYVNKRYVFVNEKKVIEEIKQSYPCGETIEHLIKEYNDRATLESKLAHDADQLELLLFLKKEYELGNKKAMEWFDKTEQRLETNIAKLLAQEIKTIHPDSWWLTDPDDPHWIKPQITSRSF